MGHVVADVGGERGAPHGDDLEVPWRYAVEEAFARADGDRCDVGAELVDAASGEVLVNRGRSAVDGDVAVSRGAAGPLHAPLAAVGHYSHHLAPLHLPLL